MLVINLLYKEFIYIILFYKRNKIEKESNFKCTFFVPNYFCIMNMIIIIKNNDVNKGALILLNVIAINIFYVNLFESM